MLSGTNQIYGRRMIIPVTMYITDSLQNAKSLKMFKDFVVKGQGLEVQGQRLDVKGQGLANWSSRIRTFLEDYNNNTGNLVCCQIAVVWLVLHHSLSLLRVVD